MNRRAASLLSPIVVLALCVCAAAQTREPRKLFPIQGERGGVGFIDREGRVVIPPEGVDFEGVVRAGQFRLPEPPYWQREEREGEHPYRRAVHVSEFSEGLARFSINTRPGSRALFLAYGYIDETGRVVIPPGAEYDTRGDFHDGRALVEGPDNRRGYIDRTGRIVVPTVYQYTWQFSEGLASASRDGKRYGYIDTEGRPAIPFRFHAAMHFSEGLALVNTGGERLAYIDRTGRLVFRLAEGLYGGEFHEGLAWVREGLRGKYGFMDRTGRRVVAAEFEEVRDFSEGLALVKRDDAWGFIDREGRAVIPFKYAYGSSFSEGLAAVTISRAPQGSGWGYVDREGRTRIPHVYSYAMPFSGGLAAVDLTPNSQAGETDAYIDPDGRTVWRRPE